MPEIPRTSIPEQRNEAKALISPISNHPPNYIYLIPRHIPTLPHTHRIERLKTKEVVQDYRMV